MEGISNILEDLLKTFSYLTARESSDWPAVNVPQEHLVEFCRELRDSYHFTILSDATGIDWGIGKEQRYTTVYHVYSPTRHIYLRLACDCIGGEEPKVPSVSSVWPAADWHEREAYDMLGIQFIGHPDLRRILMWDEYPYHPLRKDFPLAGIEMDHFAEEIKEQTPAKVIAAPMAGGPFRAGNGDDMSKNEPKGADQSWTEKSPKPSE